MRPLPQGYSGAIIEAVAQLVELEAGAPVTQIASALVQIQPASMMA